MKIDKTSDRSAKIIAIILICVAVVTVAVAVAARIFFSPENLAKRELEKIAKDYYENYYYEGFVLRDGEDPYVRAKEIQEVGTASVELSQLLLFDNERHAESGKYFSQKNYTCSKKTTTVKFYPVAPYGKTDYKVVYKYDCE